MNVYQKILLKIFELTKGKETVDVDLIELTKKEGFYSNIDNIAKQLQSEGWVSETTRKFNLRITHWGAMEAKRLLAHSPDSVNEVEKNSTRLLADARELVIMLEEFAAKPDKEKLARIDARLGELRDRSGVIKEHL